MDFFVSRATLRTIDHLGELDPNEKILVIGKDLKVKKETTVKEYRKELLDGILTTRNKNN